MYEIRLLEKEELKIVHELAHAIWPSTFKEILSPEQIVYMLNWMYRLEKLESQLDEGHQFFILEEEGNPLGFMGIEQISRELVKVHKIYILPNQQGKGLGKKMFQFLENLFPEASLTLNVNRFNKATQFYKQLGFKISKEENIDIGNGYWMEDYVLIKSSEK